MTDSSPFGDVFQGGGEMGSLMRGYDWAATPLGRPEGWPRSLQSIVRMMLTSRYQMWMAWGEDLTFFCNDAYTPTLGVKHPRALGQPASQVWAEIWPDVGPLIDQVLTTGQATYSEGMLLFLERSGFREETYHTFSYSPLFDDAGSVAGMFCVVVEETDRVINERQLDTLRKLASTTAGVRTETELFEAVQAELARNLADLPFTLTYLFDEDRAAARLVSCSGVPTDAEIAAPMLAEGDLFWPAALALRPGAPAVIGDLARHFAGLPRGARDRSPENALLFPIVQSGQEIVAGFLVVGLNPYRTPGQAYHGFVELLAGQIAAALASAHAYEAERRRAEALAEIDRAKTAFFSNVSHEFRTPLTLMLGPLEEVMAEGAGADVGDRIALAHRNGVRLLRLVNSLLDFSRIEAGRVQAAYAPTDLAAFNGEIASSFRSAMERVGVDLVIRAEPLPGQVYLDREVWEKVLLNLLSNAFKFTFEGRVTVETGPSADGDFAEVRVSDTGIGVEADQLPRLFERFHRIEGARGRSFEGSGIGLALVYELVKLHGGTITVASTPGWGTVFTIRLPFGAAHLPADQVRDTAPMVERGYAAAMLEEAERWLPEGQILPGPAAAAAVTHTGDRVLLADDNTDMRAYVQRLLEARGYQVEAVGDGKAALDAARRQPPDLILSDVMMPVLDGFGLLRAVRGETGLAEVPVVLLSARAGEEAKVEGLEAGADDYLIKPFAARELLARVAVNIQMARLRRDAARAVIQSEQKALITQERLELALASGRIAIFEYNGEQRHVTMFGPLTATFGMNERAASEGLPLDALLDGIDARDRERLLEAIRNANQHGQDYEVECRIVAGGVSRTVLIRGGVHAGPEGRPRIVGALIDISEEKQTQALLREQTGALETLNETGSAVAAELDLAKVVQAVTDAGVQLTKAEFGAFFYNVVADSGEAYMLYTLSGAPREAFAGYPMPRNTAVFGPTFAGERVVRSDDITLDPAYGKNSPEHGMPKGHLPVRSYLAVPVKARTGEVLGGLFFGHGQAGVFDERAETVMTGLAAQAAVAIDNARLFQAAQREIEQRRGAEAKLQALNAELGQRVSAEVAERMKVEETLRQAQKMEAVGQLTGGVAHDFNNLLTVIIGGLDTVRRNAPSDNARLTRALDMATQGANRAATLTSRLLAFSRRQPLEPKPLDLNVIVRQSTELLHRTLGETIELEGVLAQRLWPVEVDQNQLESAILNLAVNARDAMLKGGKLTIETANTLLDESYAYTDTEVAPGQYAMLSISDSGSGMSRQVLERAFEPFYTTKEVGKGTGLGLSMVYGFAKQSGGHVTIYSEPSEGTTVKLYFPRYTGELAGAAASVKQIAPEGMSGETVLLVEDNDEVRAYSASVLNELGYHVMEAADATAGLAILREAGRIDLLFTDVVLPGRSGRELADEAITIRPELKVLYTTGYSRNAIVHQGRLDAGVNLISKPFTFEQLAQRLRDVLDG